MKRLHAFLIALQFAVVPASVNAGIVQLSEQAFRAGAGKITFSEKRRNTRSPSFAPGDYGGGAGAPKVTTGGWYAGQRLSLRPGADCPGAAATACVVGMPAGPLRLDPSAPQPFITVDSSFPSSPTLTGAPRFNGPIALLFDRDQVGVGFVGGTFNARRSTGITAFARDGTRLGTVSNSRKGREFLGLVTSDGTARIAGVALVLVGAEPAGFNIDNVRFGQADQLELPPEVKPTPPKAKPAPPAAKPAPKVLCCH